MAKDTSCRLRVTVNVDLTNAKEILFVRAFLLRMNVLHAATKPGGAKAKLLDGHKLREIFERERPGSKQRTTPTVIFAGPPKPPKQRVVAVVERTMQLAGFTAEISGVDTDDDA